MKDLYDFDTLMRIVIASLLALVGLILLGSQQASILVSGACERMKAEQVYIRGAGNFCLTQDGRLLRP